MIAHSVEIFYVRDNAVRYGRHKKDMLQQAEWKAYDCALVVVGSASFEPLLLRT